MPTRYPLATDAAARQYGEGVEAVVDNSVVQVAVIPADADGAQADGQDGEAP